MNRFINIKYILSTDTLYNVFRDIDKAQSEMYKMLRICDYFKSEQDELGCVSKSKLLLASAKILDNGDFCRFGDLLFFTYRNYDNICMVPWNLEITKSGSDTVSATIKNFPADIISGTDIFNTAYFCDNCKMDDFIEAFAREMGVKNRRSRIDTTNLHNLYDAMLKNGANATVMLIKAD